MLRTPRDVGALIRATRRRAGLGQAELAEKVGVSRQWIIATERGKPRAELGLVLRTLTALGISLTVADEKAPADIAAPDINAVVEAARKKRR